MIENLLLSGGSTNGSVSVLGIGGCWFESNPPDCPESEWIESSNHGNHGGALIYLCCLIIL